MRSRHLVKGALRAALLTAALSLAVTGCGRKGDLEAPPEAKVEGQQPRSLTAGTAPRQVPDKPFILDGLL